MLQMWSLGSHSELWLLLFFNSSFKYHWTIIRITNMWSFWRLVQLETNFCKMQVKMQVKSNLIATKFGLEIVKRCFFISTLDAIIAKYINYTHKLYYYHQRGWGMGDQIFFNSWISLKTVFKLKYVYLPRLLNNQISQIR